MDIISVLITMFLLVPLTTLTQIILDLLNIFLFTYSLMRQDIQITMSV